MSSGSCTVQALPNSVENLDTNDTQQTLTVCLRTGMQTVTSPPFKTNPACNPGSARLQEVVLLIQFV